MSHLTAARIMLGLVVGLCVDALDAHSGGIDVYGCHRDRTANEYHCPSGPLIGRTFPNQETMLNDWPTLPTPTYPVTRTGVAVVVDGDSIKIRGRAIRLQGIDAPEITQTCRIDGKRYGCGQLAALVLTDKIGGRTVSCATVEVDKYGRDVAFCSVGDEDLNRWMVSEGWARAYAAYSVIYVAEEVSARKSQKGMWRGTFADPWTYRHR